jgi:hypothetical protein
MSWTRSAATLRAAVCMGLLVSATAACAEEGEFGRSGPFLGAGALYAFNDFGGDASDPEPDDTWGYRLGAGYRFNEYFALELTGEHFVSFEDSAGDTMVAVAAANGKLYPISGWIQPYVSVGAGWSWVDDERAGSNENSSGFAARFAGGVDVYFHRNWAAFFEVGYFLPTGARDDYGAVPLSFGVIYRFF